MAQIPQQIIDNILDAANIVDVIGEDVTLKKQGVNYVGLCPFHNEKTPSFIVSPAKGICKCFSCGKGGNVIWYKQEHDSLTFPEAVRELGKKNGIDVPSIELSPEQQANKDRQSAAMIAITEAQRLFRENLLASPDAIQYLHQRNIGKAMIDLFGLGFAFDYSSLTRLMTERGYSTAQIIDAGLGYLDEKNKLKDNFWQRIMFPFFSKSGQVLGFTGRAVNDQPAKYKNSADTLLFSKGRTLFGLYQARQAIQQEDIAYIVEGQFDVISMAQCGIRNVVCGSGTAFTEEQRRLLHSITSNVVFIYDGDAAGQAAAAKNLLPFIQDKFKVRCVLLPEGRDPDEMVRSMGEHFIAYLRAHEEDYVDFLWKTLHKEGDNDFQRLDIVKRIVSLTSHESEAVIRNAFNGQLAVLSGYSLQDIDALANEVKVVLPDKFETGFFGLEFAKDYIDADDPVLHLTNDFGRFQRNVCNEEPYVFYSGIPSTSQIQELNQYACRLEIHQPDMIGSSRHESNDCKLMKTLFQYGLTVDVSDGGDVQGFVYYYVDYYGELIKETKPNPETKNEYLARCAEVIACTSPAIQTANLSDWAEALGLKTTVLRELIKPFVNERKSKAKMNRELSDIYDDLTFEQDRVPDYVEQNEEYSKMLRRYGFYPQLNKTGIPVCYMFKTDNNSFKQVADFYIEPLFHVYSSNREENRRVIRLNSLFTKKSTYVEWPSSTFAKLSTLQDALINEGAFNFLNGEAKDYTKIWACISYNFPKCTELKVFGQQEEGCFAFSNGIFHQVEEGWRFEYCNDLGLMYHDDSIFYSPAFSKINVGQRKDNDQYEQDRWLKYTETAADKRITFSHWAELMDEVYKINNNGKWALLYAIMCAFRSDIYPINRLFTSIFFIGPTMSGKTQIAVSIRSLFVKPEAPSFNLNSGTDAAFFSVLERFRDVPQIMEEYNDEMISDQKFQGLKSTTYDGEGKQKRKSATGNDIETSKVNAPIILLGQEAPQKDDNALSNRVVLCEVPKRDSINEERAKLVFEELKDHEKNGLSYLLLEVLELRPIVKKHFASVLKMVSRELQAKVEMTGSRSGDQTRIINTVSMFCATCKILTEFAPQMRLPFTYDEFETLAVDKVRSQVDMLMRTDKLATFFNTIDYLIDKGSIKYGRDFKIERPTKLKLKGGREVVLQPADTAVLYMNLSNIHKMYAASISNGEKPFTLTTLEVNLNSHSSYIGTVSNTRFRWMESHEVPASEISKSEDMPGKPKDMLMARVMEKREKSTSAVVLNYDVLKRVMGIDFERTGHEESTHTEQLVANVSEQKLPF